MSQLTPQTLVDYFTVQNYPPNAEGFSEVPFEDIFAAMDKFFPGGYSWRVTHQGFKPDASAYVIIELTVTDGQGFMMTVPGSSENETGRTVGFAGLQLMAFRNAVLRNLRMGESLYKNKPQHPRTLPPAPQKTSYTYTNKPTYGKVWDGSQALKGGPYAGKPYSSVPDHDIEKWSSGSSPNVLAVKEKDRRIQLGIWNNPNAVAHNAVQNFIQNTNPFGV